MVGIKRAKGNSKLLCEQHTYDAHRYGGPEVRPFEH